MDKWAATPDHHITAGCIIVKWQGTEGLGFKGDEGVTVSPNPRYMPSGGSRISPSGGGGIGSNSLLGMTTKPILFNFFQKNP